MSDLRAQLEAIKDDHQSGKLTEDEARNRFVELTGDLTVEQLLEVTGADLNDAMLIARQVHEIANAQLMLVIERTIDLGQPGFVGLLAAYQIARLQIVANLKEGNITRGQVRGSRMAMDMLADNQMHRRDIGPDGISEPRPYNPGKSDGKPTP